ncbi:phage tail tape measure C-terminal domain-containing protein [Massilia sp. 9096]|uniref:phage tail tape measure C-terminal domain-containing protein n=1 Tax=Massilia sp. 9096 TaxID=1500894 RepID=UPI0005644CEF|nr:phage tail tape measure C-terminal domain-containing protein [Massilia sp. 9096]
MNHSIQVSLGADISKYQAGMAQAKQTSTESMGFIASIFDKIKSMFGSIWGSIKSLFSSSDDSTKKSFGSMSDSASGAFQKISSYFPAFHSDLDKTKGKMAETEQQTSSLASKIAVGLVAAIVAATVVLGAFIAKGLSVDAAYAGIATSTDIAVSQLSRFDAVAAQNGISIKELGTSFKSFHDAMMKAATGDGSDEFTRLGVKVTDANGALRDTDVVAIETAKKIAALSNETAKYDAAAKVGFGGKAQFLEDTAHAGTLVARVTDDQAAAVARLGKITHEIGNGGPGFLSQISDKLTNTFTPALNIASEAVLKAKNNILDAFQQIYGGGSTLDRLGNKIQGWATDAAQWFAKVTKAATESTVSMAKWLADKTGLGNAGPLKPLSDGFIPGTPKLNGETKTPVVTDAQKAAKQSVDQLTKSMADQIAVMQKQIETGATLTQGQRDRLTLMKSQGTVDAATLKSGLAQADQLDQLEQRFTAMQKAKAADEAATKKQQEAYARVLSIVNTKLAQQKEELLSNQNLTESQKLAIKINEELASGHLQLSKAQQATIQAALKQISANDQLTQSQKAQQEVTKYIDQSVIARAKQNASLEAEYQLYGKSADARALAMVAIDSETWKEEALAKLRAEQKPITDETLARLNQERDARTQVGQAAMGQGKALQYAYELAQENRKYAAEQITDATASKQALLQIDVDFWQERIKNAGDGTEAQMRLLTSYSQWYANQQAQLDPWFGLQQSLKQYGREASDVGTQIGNSLTNAFRGAEDAFANFVTTGKLDFRSLATSIIADLARIQAKQALSGVSGFLSSTFTSMLTGGINLDSLGSASNLLTSSTQAVDTSQFNNLDFLPHRANGGPVLGGMSYMVGERGQEVFTPSGNGTITPNHALGDDGGGVTINLTTNVNGGTTAETAGGSNADAQAMADALNAKIKTVIVQETRQGGTIWKFQQGRG